MEESETDEWDEICHFDKVYFHMTRETMLGQALKFMMMVWNVMVGDVGEECPAWCLRILHKL